MSDRRAELGRRAEDAAAAHLRRHGYEIAARNYRSRLGEVDLIAVRRDVVVFVEVRSRSGSRFGTGLESVDRRKRRRISRAAEQFVAENRLEERTLRFDVVGVEWRDGESDIEHVESAFDFEPR